MTLSNDGSAQQLSTFFKKTSPPYLNDVCQQAGHPNINTRASFLKLSRTLRRTNHVQNTLSYIAPNTWNNHLVPSKQVRRALIPTNTR